MKGNIYLAAVIYTLGYLPFAVSLCLLGALLLTLLRFWFSHKWFLGVSLFLFILSIYLSPQTTALSDENTLPEEYAGPTIIKSHPITKEFYTEFEVELSNQQMVLIRQQKVEKNAIKHGAVCLTEMSIEQVNQATNPGQFDYRSFLNHQGIHGIAYDATIEECVGSSFVSPLYEYRDRLLEQIDDVFSPNTSMWMKALLFGERSNFDDQLMESFQFWNLSHLLAISGLHVGLLLALSYAVLYFGFRISKESAMNILLVSIPVYIVLAGSQPSVIRAGLMAVLVILVTKLKMTVKLLDVLAIIYIISLVFDPYLFYQLSFQFSFLVTCSLILSKQIITTDGWLWTSIKISLISQLALLPLQFYHFYYTNVLSFLLNLLFVPYFTVFMLPVLITLLLLQLLHTPFAVLLEKLFIWINQPMMDALVGLEQFSIAQWIVGKPSILVIGIYYVIFLIMMAMWNRGKLRFTAVFAIALIGCWWMQQALPYMDNAYRITMLDVGQGDSFVIELPRRSGVLMVDAGEEVVYSHLDQSNRNTKNIIQPFLWSKGITQIDALLISHFDYDHVAGGKEIMDSFKPKGLFIAARQDLEPITRYFGDKYQPIHLMHGHRLQFGGGTIEVIAPKTNRSSGSENNHSLVFILEVDGHRTLFAGDLEESGERRILQRNLPPIDLLKVAHHGSKTSTSEAFIREVGVDVKNALISVGEDNTFNHPSQVVIKRLEDHGIKVWRTDTHGAVEMIYKNGQSTFSPFTP
ncbi:DNA internalization-related competence protein ComEC/Rec2 [Allobacillus sp. SKP2-8]|uniref:DNA internalization-related competence protein ComEC/Rec2 n=1 Tax=unclassified Allobacillus TaxID=2628859 RepID=UPI0011829C9C|nr:DNA internalization-related competence protein ComEC/Rec2 [Allobacillus sp. SKP2-8]TSJ68264.1 DNA internalization-related competence protein ComEC/Rec2 [Allobacillus sp. SKP2-8]